MNLLYVRRVAIEFDTPFIVGSGETDLTTDAPFVTDAGGLPAIPGSSIAGALRHAFVAGGMDCLRADEANDSRTNATNDERDFFGYQAGDKGQGSRLIVTWAHVHDANDTPVDGRAAPGENAGDIVLANARESSVRDHVRLTDRGGADHRGKFDERVVSAGHRFTFDMILEGPGGTEETQKARDDAFWNRLLILLNSPELTLGGKTRRGFGAFHVVRSHARVFNLTEEADFDDYRSLPVALNEPTNTLVEEQIPEATDSGGVTVAVTLPGNGFLRVGSGTDSTVDLSPISASRVRWDGGVGSVATAWLMPGSAVKGALAHRTAFHYNVANEHFIDPDATDVAAIAQQIEQWTGANNNAVATLFGWAKGGVDQQSRLDPDTPAAAVASREDNHPATQTGDTNEGRRGLVSIPDVEIAPSGAAGTAPSGKVLTHVSIDRFTGGTIMGALFDERVVNLADVEPVRIPITIRNVSEIGDDVKRALGKAIADLATGRLWVGAASGRGNGATSTDGQVAWSDGGAWIGAGNESE